MVGQTPLICSGISQGLIKASCYTFLENGSWKEDKVAALNTGRNRAAWGSVVINDQLVLAGGEATTRSVFSGSRLNTIELVSPNTRSRTLSVKLPVAVSSSCIVEWDANSFMLIGGYGGGYRRETYIIDTVRNTITNGPNLKMGRAAHGCEKVTMNGESFVIVSGGLNATQSTEVLSVANYRNGWQYGKNCIKNVF